MEIIIMSIFEKNMFENHKPFGLKTKKKFENQKISVMYGLWSGRSP